MPVSSSPVTSSLLVQSVRMHWELFVVLASRLVKFRETRGRGYESDW
jgi:hypothetical protein